MLRERLGEAFGKRLVDVRRLRGGSRKGVYRLTAADGSTAVAYLWSAAENYWPAADNDGDLADPFSSTCGLEPFLAAHKRLVSLGVRVPEVYHAHGDLALVEDVPGDNLETRFARDPRATASTVERLGEFLNAMRACRAPAFGHVGWVDAGGLSHRATCEATVLAFALRCLADAAARDRRVADAHDPLAGRLHTLAAAVRPRTEYSVVHGELGLDHVLVDRHGTPVIIDFEHLLYFDVEWEHVFLRIRLHGDYERLAADGLDEDRLALYMLAQRLSLVAGPLRLLEGDFPDRAFMRGIVEHNLREALTWVGCPE
ncbi:aminoglycoside phosphotransferase [Virgisporangium aliadipatigenens]|uniref:Aminoglycoside phosphotransferase n=1 Tax=Virgisporangium aliadipatigenens TaxID=741659 RepID=A0A8J4DPZ8_9ACTN|nr:phosphotransferase [Virgisporangium aliadipatigenens]GIJ46059.1 aminoglycoside phosphotransferase [Virgisporangium aliadipatigenens]